jgi:hypothetical protein
MTDLPEKLAALSAFADDVNITHDPAAQRLADQIAASDPGLFTKAEVAKVVRATIVLCEAAGVDPIDVGPHVIETVLGHRAIAAAGGSG